MEDLKHSIGPWFINKNCKELIVDNSEDPVCTVSMFPYNKDVTRANAKLIAAAPELLQAALDFIGKVESGRARSTDSYNKFKAAVQKATNN
jgi:hypothetical protein